MKIFKNNKVSISKSYKNKYINWLWSFKILFFAFALTIIFSIISETVLKSSTIFFAVIIILSFLIINIIFDMIGVAITSADINKIKSAFKNNVYGARESLILIKNADKVAVFCCDIIGDICGILSGACCASIVIKIIGEINNASLSIILSAIISSVVACITIFCKSIEKGYAVNKAEKIILFVGKLLKHINFKIK